IHMNDEAQAHIAEAVRRMTAEVPSGLIALEGDVNPIDLSRLANFPHHDSITSAAELLLKRHKISGPILAAISPRARTWKVLGVDDAAFYRQNVQAYLTAVHEQKKIKETIRRGG